MWVLHMARRLRNVLFYVPRTSEEFDGVSFFQRVTNLVNIDNAIRPSQSTSSSQANVANGSSHADQVDPQVSGSSQVSRSSSQSSGSSQVDQVDPQLLKKALEECITEIKISTMQIEELDSRSSTLLQFTYQVLGFFLVFEGAMIAVTFNETSFFDKRAFEAITFMSALVGVICIFAIFYNVAAALYLKRRRDEENFRLQMYERYKRQLLKYGVEFKFNLHQEFINPNSVRIKLRLVYWLYSGILLYMGAVLYLTLSSEYRVIHRREDSTLANSRAPAFAPGVEPVQSGKTWCVAKAGSPDIDVMNGRNFACGEGGADCGPIQAGGACFSPDTVVSHASFAYNTYYQNKGRNPWNCYFGGTSVITITDPSYSGCRFL